MASLRRLWQACRVRCHPDQGRACSDRRRTAQPRISSQEF
jgi:hypothetical protein